MRRRPKPFSPKVLAFLRASYEHGRELTHPIPDHVMKRVTRERMVETYNALDYEDRVRITAP